MLTSKERGLLQALEPMAEERGVEIVTVEIVGSRKSPTIRVYIDTEDGVSFDQLSQAQEWIDKIIDDIDPFPGAYTLEVSSPGVDRPLRTPEHFISRVGQTVQVKSTKTIEGRGSWTGKLVNADEEGIIIEAEEASYEIPYDCLKKANLKGIVEFRKEERKR